MKNQLARNREQKSTVTKSAKIKGNDQRDNLVSIEQERAKKAEE